MPERESGSQQSYYVWEPAQRNITVLINLRLVEGMKEWLEQGHRSGQEVGGILLGSAQQDSTGQRIVTVEDCATIRIAHSRGPSFTLGAQDTRPLENAVVHWRHQKKSSSTPVGFARSHLRPGLYLDTADFSLFWNYFPNPSSVFLLVRPQPEAKGGFFFWEDGDVHRQAPYLSFPLDPKKLESDAAHTVLSGPALPSTEISTPDTPLVNRIVPQSLALKSPKFSVQPGDGPRLAGIGAALTFLLLFALLWNGSAVARKTTVPRGAELGLNIDHLGPALRLTWNPHHTLIENATHGVLWVVDGSARKKIDLNERQLAHGSAMYVPASDQVEFRLEVSGQGKPVANSILSLTPVVQQQAPESEKPAPVPPEEEEEGAASQKQSAPAQPAVATEEQHASVKPQAMNTTASVAPAALASENTATVAKVQPVPAPLVAKQESSRLFERQALPSVSFTYANDPILEQPKRKGIDKVPVLRLFHHHQNKPATVEEGMVPAKPIRAFKPHVPMDVARTLPGEWKVDLRARIDEKGRVSQLEPLSLDQDQRLVRVAMNAVNDWDFEPANIDGRGVNSGLIVTFHFHIPQQPDSERSASRH